MKVNANTQGYWAGGPDAKYSVWGSEPTKWGPGCNNFLFAAGAIAVIGGLLFPVSTHFLDVLLIFSMSLTVAALMVTLSARSASQAQGFPLLIILATMLYIVLGIASAKLLMLDGDTGTIISFIGAIFVGGNCALAVLIFGILAMVVFGIIWGAVKGIIHNVTEFTSDIIPIKQISVDADLVAGVIKESQALELQRKIACEAGFFVAMTGVARFIFCGTIIESIIIFVNIAALMAVKNVVPTATGMSVKAFMASAVGATVLIQTSVLVAALACRHLVRRSSVYSAASDGISKQKFTERVEIVSRVREKHQKLHLIPSGKLDYKSSGVANPNTESGVETDETVLAEWFDESECIENEIEKDDFNLWVSEEIKDNDCYRAIVELIESKSADRPKTVLTAAESVKELSVTVPVNVAIRLAQRGKRCLLIDFDTERNAVSKVFDIDTTAIEQSFKAGQIEYALGVPTCINNLWIWPASLLDKIGKSGSSIDAIDIKEIITGLESKYDRLVIYAPNLASLLTVAWNSFADCTQAAMLFGSKSNSSGTYISDLHKLLVNAGCEILKPEEVFAEAF